MRARPEGRRRPDDPGDHRGLGEGQVGGALAEGLERERLHTVHRPEGDPVQVEFEDALLRQLGLEQQREDGFAQLAAHGALAREEERARQLLGDRARAFDRCAAAQVVQDGAAHRERVDPPVAPEAPVFGRHDRQAQRGGDLRDRDVDAPAVEREPGFSRFVEEQGAARAGRQAPDGPRMGHDPDAADERAGGDRDEQHPTGRPRNAPSARTARGSCDSESLTPGF